MRKYRVLVREQDLIFFQVVVKETDLYIGISKARFTLELAKRVKEKVEKTRVELEQYIELDPTFLQTLEPYDPLAEAPEIAREMALAGKLAGVGPMASVAGAIADRVGKFLFKYSPEVIVENGGDIFLRSKRKRQVGIYAGNSPLSYKLALEVPPFQTPLGICTSSGTVGPSLSLGKADAAVIVAKNATLADAVATATANLVQGPSDVKKAALFASDIPGVFGAVVIKDDQLAAVGKIKLVPFNPP